MTKKQCQACNKTKPVSEFFKSMQTKDGLFSYCKPCKVDANRKSDDKRRSANRVAFLNQRRGWHLKTKYGITIEKYNELVLTQNGKCLVCEGKLDDKLCVDHDHKTGKIRALLCQDCNRGLGMFKESVDSLKRAIKYLENGWY